MSKHLNDAEIEETVRKYSNMLFKLCFTVLGNNADAEDAVSETIIRYMTKSPEFKDDEYKKSWLLKVAGNICKDMCRFRSRRNHLNIDDLRDVCASENGDDLNLLEEIMQLPYKYAFALHRRLFNLAGCKNSVCFGDCGEKKTAICESNVKKAFGKE